MYLPLGSYVLNPRCLSKQEALELSWVPSSDGVDYEVVSFNLQRNCSYSDVDNLVLSADTDRISTTNYSNATFDYQPSLCYLFAVRGTKDTQNSNWETVICRAWFERGTLLIS